MERNVIWCQGPKKIKSNTDVIGLVTNSASLLQGGTWEGDIPLPFEVRSDH